VHTLFIDDLHGSEAEGTVRFGLDGAEYEIDLNAEHAPGAAGCAGTLRGGGAAGRRRYAAAGGCRARADGVDSTEVRERAMAQGIEVKDRGRAPAELIVKFKAATGTVAAGTPSAQAMAHYAHA
jgi:hypothetical protein